MNFKYVLILLFLGLYSCSSPKYIVKKQSEIVNLDLDHSSTNYIPIADNHLVSSPILDSSYMLITKKQYSRLDKYLHFLEISAANSSDIQLSKTLLLISRKKYQIAAESLTMVTDPDYSLLRGLLSIDMNYELSIKNGTFNYNAFLKRYQEFIDTYPDDPSLKQLVAIRLRYLRYTY